MEIEDCQNCFDYDGERFDVHISTFPQLTLKAMYWAPAEVKGSIVYNHGYNSLKISERDMATLMNQRGYAFFACDHIGHGESEGLPNDCTPEDVSLESIEVVKKAHELYPEKPIFLMGHSLGGCANFFSALFHTQELIDNKVAGIICFAPFLGHPPERQVGFFSYYYYKFIQWWNPRYTFPFPSSFEPSVNQGFTD